MGTPGYVGLWTHAQARAQQVLQLAASACGATAVATALRALLPPGAAPSDARVLAACTLHPRANSAPLPQYLASRGVAGCTALELLASAEAASGGAVRGAFEPGARFAGPAALLQRLAVLLQQRAPRAVVVAALNLQLLGNDAWHFQVVYGVELGGAGRVHCCNPQGAYSAAEFFAMVSSPSVVLVRREDVLRRLSAPGGDESVFARPAWRSLRVAEALGALIADEAVAHLAVPADYVGGLAVLEAAGPAAGRPLQRAAERK